MTNTETIQPLVSIALCTYNGAAYIKQQLDSITDQSYTNLEIIICDDASVDDTIKIIEEYRAKEPRIILYRNDTNIGYNKNFEKAFSLCSGDYIAISDQDDVWEKEKIELMMKNWSAGSSFVYSLSGNFMNDDFAGRTEAPNVRYTAIDDLHKLVFNSPVHGHACMFKKELLQLCVPFPYDIYYDWWMSMHAAAAGTIGCIPITLTWHRDHSQNSSRTLMTIKDREERDKQLRKQMIYFIETFCHSVQVAAKQRDSLLRYTGILKEMDGKRFHADMFLYVLKNRKLIFHYKKNKAFAFLSHLKHARRMGYRGLL